MLPTSSCGVRLSSRAIGHTGFTGTSLWIDPARDLYVVLLTNRVHPSRDGVGIQDARRALHDAVVTALEGAALA
jgi:CubicO group peptidase (beta-lactamase class C family)